VNELRKGFDGTFQMDKVLADMQKAIPEQCRTKKTVFHCSLNPHPDEKLSDERLVQLAKEYMESLGYGKQPYIVFKHNDIAREHIHIVSLRVDFDGNKINDKYEGRRSKKITELWRKSITLSQVQRSVRKLQQKHQRSMLCKGISRSKWLAPFVLL